MATHVGEGDGPDARLAIAIVDGVGIRPAWYIFSSATPSAPRHPRLAFSRPVVSPPSIQPLSVGLVGALLDHPVPPVLLQNEVLALDLIALLLRHGVVALHALLGLFGLKGLVFSRGLEMSHSHVVPLTITGPHLLDTVKGRFLSLSVPPLAHPILLGVPLFLALPWRIHGPVRSGGTSTRPPTLSVF